MPEWELRVAKYIKIVYTKQNESKQDYWRL